MTRNPCVWPTWILKQNWNSLAHHRLTIRLVQTRFGKSFRSFPGANFFHRRLEFLFNCLTCYFDPLAKAEKESKMSRYSKAIIQRKCSQIVIHPILTLFQCNSHLKVEGVTESSVNSVCITTTWKRLPHQSPMSTWQIKIVKQIKLSKWIGQHNGGLKP